jgi:hypothetical protein
MLVAAGYQVFAINPAQVARYRERHVTSGAGPNAPGHGLRFYPPSAVRLRSALPESFPAALEGIPGPDRDHR